MKVIYLVILLIACENSFSQDTTSKFGQEVCENYVINGISSTPNLTENNHKNGLWTFYYNENGELVDNPDESVSFQIIELKNDTPISIGCMCTNNGDLEGYGKYLNDTTWTLDSTSVWFDKKGKVESKVIYDKGVLKRYEEYSNNGYLFSSEDFTFENNDTISVHKLYRKDGSVKIVEERLNGVENGSYNIYYPSGNSRVAAYYENGFRIIDSDCYRNGKTKFETKCTSPTEPCLCTKYDKKGKKVREYPTQYKIVKRITR